MADCESVFHRELPYQFKSFSYFHFINISPAVSLNTDLSFSVNRRLQLPAWPFRRNEAISSFRLVCHSSSGLDSISVLILLSKDVSIFFTPRNFQSFVISSKGVSSRSS